MRYFIDTNLIIYFFDYGYDFKIDKKKNEPNVKKENYLKATPFGTKSALGYSATPFGTKSALGYSDLF